MASNVAEDVALLIKKIEGLVHANEEILDRLLQPQRKVVTKRKWHVYATTSAERPFTLKRGREEVKSVTLQDAVKTWKPEPNKMKAIDDVFNDGLDVNYVDFKSLKSLNGMLGKVAKKYKMFGGSAHSMEALGLFKCNLEEIQCQLGVVEEKYNKITQDAEDQTAFIEMRVKQMIAARQSMADFPGMTFASSNSIAPNGTLLFVLETASAQV